MFAIFSTAAITFSLTLAWKSLIGRNRFSELALESAALKERIIAKDLQIFEIKDSIQKKEIEITRIQKENLELSTLTSQLKEKIRSEEEKISTISDLGSRFSDTFKALSSEALKNNNQSFLDLAKSSLEKFQETAKGDLDKRSVAIDELVKPLKDSLMKVDGKLGQLELGRASAQTALVEQLKTLSDSNLQLKDQTDNLVKALRKPIVRGRWGEIQLKRVVELAGMTNYCDFVEQESVTTETGRLRPDMIIRLPNEKNVVVDSKVPLEAYLEAIEAKDDETRNSKLKDHARQIRQLVTQLASKNYWEQFQPAPEFVILFLPGENFYTAALEYDPELIEFSAMKNVVLATPMTLISLLKAVAYGWRQDRIAENAQEICTLGKELYDRVKTFVTHMSDMKKGIDKTVDAYNKSVNSLESRVLVTVRKFKELGVTSADEIEELQAVEKSALNPQLISDTTT